MLIEVKSHVFTQPQSEVYFFLFRGVVTFVVIFVLATDACFNVYTEVDHHPRNSFSAFAR